MGGLTIGVDVGGTNTDAAIIKNTDVICSGKTPTTADITSGLERAINIAINNLPHEYSRQDVKRVNIGTTHFVNAVVQRRDIVPVAVLRICGPASHSVPPFCDFPPDLKKAIAGPCYYLQGGYEFDGQQVISNVEDEEIRRVAREIQSNEIKNVVITGVFSPVRATQENHVKDLLLQSCSDYMSLTLSHEVGMIGYLERENASILNETLKPLCSKTVAGFRHALQRIGLKCPFYLTQNDGTIMRAQKALQFPVLTFASGPTNSMRGTAHLSQMKDAIVVDIGGTTTDVGVLNNGFPRQASTRVKVGGVNTNFRMPDVLSIGLGGGSHVMEDKNKGHVTVGPRSVGYKLEEESRVFGGEVLTATDIAVAESLCDLGDRTKVKDLTDDFKMKSLDAIKKMIEDALDQVKTSKEDQPVILVGGGSILVDKRWQLKGASTFLVPPHFQCSYYPLGKACKGNETATHLLAYMFKSRKGQVGSNLTCFTNDLQNPTVVVAEENPQDAAKLVVFVLSILLFFLPLIIMNAFFFYKWRLVAYLRLTLTRHHRVSVASSYGDNANAERRDTAFTTANFHIE